MAAEAVGVSPRDTVQLPGTEANSSPGLCILELVARVVSCLLGRTVSECQVRERAIALGLPRQSGLEPAAELTCRGASRLFLAGYRLPAQVEPGTPRALCEHLCDGQHVFIPLCDLDPGAGPSVGPMLFQLTGYHAHGRAGAWLSLVPVGAWPPPIRPVRMRRFAAAWAPTGCLLFAAARRWQELPDEGTRFFGGCRDADGSYHWDVAECATDRQGRVLRC